MKNLDLQRVTIIALCGLASAFLSEYILNRFGEGSSNINSILSILGFVIASRLTLRFAPNGLLIFGGVLAFIGLNANFYLDSGALKSVMLLIANLGIAVLVIIPFTRLIKSKTFKETTWLLLTYQVGLSVGYLLIEIVWTKLKSNLVMAESRWLLASTGIGLILSIIGGLWIKNVKNTEEEVLMPIVSTENEHLLDGGLIEDEKQIKLVSNSHSHGTIILNPVIVLALILLTYCKSLFLFSNSNVYSTLMAANKYKTDNSLNNYAYLIAILLGSVLATVLVTSKIKPLYLTIAVSILSLILDITILFPGLKMSYLSYIVLNNTLKGIISLSLLIWIVQTLRNKDIGGGIALYHCTLSLGTLSLTIFDSLFYSSNEGCTVSATIVGLIVLSALCINMFENKAYISRFIYPNVYDSGTESYYSKTASPIYARFEKRFWAATIDIFVLSIIGYLLTFLLLGSVPLLVPFIQLLYFPIMEANFGRTIGKSIMGIHVINIDGEQPYGRQVFIRTLCRFIPLYFIALIFEGEGIHDMVSETMVVDSEMYELVDEE